MKSFFLILVIVLAALTSHADIKGKVIDSEGKPLPMVTLVLLDSTGKNVLKTAVSNEGGEFFLLGEMPNSAKLLFNLLGFEKKIISLTSLSNSDDLGPITLANSTDLKEVKVIAQRPLVEMKEGKIIMNVQSSISAPGASVLEILQRAPNVSVDNNDQLSLKGRQGVQVMVDGKLLQLQGDELASLLKNMPASSLDQVEIISAPGAQYDAAGTAGLINLITKREKRAGYNGSANINYTQAVYPKLNAGANFNFRTRKWNVFLNANAAQRQGFNQLEMERIFLNQNEPTGSYLQDNYARIKMKSGALNGGVDYHLTDKSILGASLSENYLGYTFNGDNRGRRFDENYRYKAYFNSTNSRNNNNRNYGINVNWRHKLDTLGAQLTADADYAFYEIDNEQTQSTRYYLPDGQFEKPAYIMQGLMPGEMKIKSLKADYKKPLNASTHLESGAKWSNVMSDNAPVFYDISNGEEIYDPTKSNHFIYKENLAAAYVQASKDWKKITLQAGLRYEHTLAYGKQLNGGENFSRNYGQFFPNMVMSYISSPQHQWSINLSRRIDRPNYHQLNPFKDYIDPTSIHQGNPYLKPSLSYNSELSYLYKNRFSTSVSYSRTTDVITQVIVLDDQDPNITLVTNRNLAVNDVWSINGNYPFQPTAWWSSINNLSFYYSRFSGNLSNTPLRDGIPTAYISSNNSITLPKNWSVEVNAWYISKQLYGYMALQPMYALNLGIQKQLLQKAATIRLAATDVFWTQNPTGSSSFSNYKENFIVTRDTRSIQLSLTYRFGDNKWQRVRHEGGSTEEKRRASTEAG